MTGDYIVGLAGLLAIAISLAIAARGVRRLLLPEWERAPAILADAILALALFVAAAQLLGLVGALSGPTLVIACIAAAVVCAFALPGRLRGTRAPPSGKPLFFIAAGGGRPRASQAELGVAIAITLVVAAQWATPTLLALDRGIYGGDSLWYHMPFAAEIAQSGSVTGLLYTDPLYLNWFYPQNSELVHAGGLLLFGNDFLSPLMNLAWLGLALLAAWCCGRPYGAGAPALAGVGSLLAADLLFSRQPGNANNDIVALALFLAAVAILLNAARPRRGGGPSTAALLIAALAAGLALGTKLTVLVPVAALTIGVIAIAGSGSRARATLWWTAGLAAGSLLWYARNLIVAGNPLPWVGLGPFPRSEELQGRDEHSVFDYLTDTDVWSDYFVPGLEERLGDLWPLVLLVAVAGVVVALSGGDRVRRMLALVAAVSAIAYLLTPLSASGPEGAPVGFRLNLRYLAPALALALVLAAIPPTWAAGWERWWRGGALALFGLLLLAGDDVIGALEGDRLAGTVLLVAAFGVAVAAVLLWRRGVPRAAVIAGVCLAVLVLSVAGRSTQRDYLDLRYSAQAPDYPRAEHPSIELGLGLGAAYDWARGERDQRIGLSGELGALFQYGLWGPDSSNAVRYIGERGGRGSFLEPAGCADWVGIVNDGGLDYVVTTPAYDQDDPGSSTLPEQRRWMARDPAASRVAGAELVDVWRLSAPLDPELCGPGSGAP